jgi:recombination protein RecA
MQYISTGSLGVDGLFGGGWLRGTIGEIWGGPGTGKTTLAQHAVNDLEPGLDSLWVSVGTEVPHRPMRTCVVAPKTAETVFSMVNVAIQVSAGLIVIDSANGLIRSREFEGSPDYAPYYVPSTHREFKAELNHVVEQCARYGSTVLFLSKPRDTERSPIRGTGVSERAAQRVTLKILTSHQDGSRVIEASIKDGSSCEYVLRPGTGIDWAEELLRLATEHDIVTKRGSWYIMPDQHRVQGTDEAVEYVKMYPAIAAYLSREVRSDLHID